MDNLLSLAKNGIKPKNGKTLTGVIKQCPTCGKEFYRKLCQSDRKYCCSNCYPRAHLKGRIGSEGQRVAMRLRKGILHPCWIKDRTKVLENTRLRNSEDSQKWRMSVFHRDDFTCQDCGEKGGCLSAHHIRPWRDYPELRYEINNGITLCKECHIKTILKEDEFFEIYSQILLKRLT
jgi:5-methylcytosine-specific restriction endonuclease McrA